MKNLRIFLSILALAPSLTLMGGQYGYGYGYDQNGYDSCCCPQTCCPPTCCQPACCGWGSFAFGADWLYWETTKSDLTFADETLSVETATGDIDTIRPLRPRYKYDNGYRIFGSYTTCDDNWVISAIFSHVPAHLKNDFVADEFEFITVNPFNFPIFSLLDILDFSEASGNWHSSINYLDIDLARNFNVCDTFSISPHVGARGLWIREKFSFDAVAPTALLEFSGKNRICAGGLEGGLVANWDFFGGFSLFGNIGGSLLYGKFRNNFDLNGVAVIDEVATTEVASLSDHDWRGVAMFDLMVGVRYAANWCGWGFDFHVAWEQHLIHNTDHNFRSCGASTSMHGLTLGAAVEF